MVCISFMLRGTGGTGILRDLLLFIIMAILVSRHYIDFPFKNKRI
jgi:hypothetical protein